MRRKLDNRDNESPPNGETQLIFADISADGTDPRMCNCNISKLVLLVNEYPIIPENMEISKGVSDIEVLVTITIAYFSNINFLTCVPLTNNAYQS